MDMLIGIGGFIGFFVFLILFIIKLFKKEPKRPAVIGMLTCIVLFFVGLTMAPSSSREKSQSKAESEPSQSVDTKKDPGQENPSDEPIYSDPGIMDAPSIDLSGYMEIDANLLFEYNAYLGGQKVITVITAESVDENSVKARTENNEGFFFSVLCKFESKDTPDSVKEGDIITVAGVVKEQDPLAETISFLDTPTAVLQDCYIVGHGEIAQSLKEGAEGQRQTCEGAKQAYEASIAAAKKEERDEYIGQCEIVSYSDVERNPDNYDGKLIKISGKVIQVSEGWFDSVTLRIDCGGNTWLVSYSREDGESRILEDDNITCYGKCTGVTSYKTVLGNTVTVPSMNMEYYD